MAGWIGRLPSEDVAEAHSLLLETVEESASPHKFCGEDAKAKKNGEPARPWGNDHDNAKREQRKTEYDLHPPLRLLHGLYQHRGVFTVGAATSTVRSAPAPLMQKHQRSFEST